MVPPAIEPVVLEDPAGDEVLACAKSARAERIVSGDTHRLRLERYEGIEIQTAAQFVAGFAAAPPA